MGVFILPIVVGLQAIPVVWPGVENRDPLFDSPWFWVHVASLLFAYASFALVWASQARALSPDNANLQAMSMNDPKILMAVLTWAVYSFAMFARRTLGWTGRRAAWLSALGFAIVLLNFVPISYFVTTSHTFE
jgi:ABC-type uncharacterized transport system permease subunit